MRRTADVLLSQKLIPALREEPGFAGTLNLVDSETGDGITIVMWETAEQARRPLQDTAPGFAGRSGTSPPLWRRSAGSRSGR